jgi:hypothetical protein
MDNGKEVNVTNSVGLTETLTETEKNLTSQVNSEKLVRANIMRLDRERKDCKDTLDAITKSNEDIKS